MLVEEIRFLFLCTSVTVSEPPTAYTDVVARHLLRLLLHVGFKNGDMSVASVESVAWQTILWQKEELRSVCIARRPQGGDTALRGGIWPHNCTQLTQLRSSACTSTAVRLVHFAEVTVSVESASRVRDSMLRLCTTFRTVRIEMMVTVNVPIASHSATSRVLCGARRGERSANFPSKSQNAVFATILFWR